MVQAREWTGFEAVALQEAMRLSVRQFAEKLGIDTTTINNWRTGLGTVRPRNKTQQILDTTLRLHADQHDRDRFEAIVAAGEAAWRASRNRRSTPTTEPVVSTATTRLQDFENATEIVQRMRKLHDNTVEEPVLTALEIALRDILDRYELEGPIRLVPEALALRREVDSLTEGCRQPHHLARLYRLAGQISGALAYMAVNLGRFRHSEIYIQETLALAQFARDPELMAWIRGTESFSYYYQGKYQQAADAAREGIRTAAGNQQAIRLYSNGLARALGKLGDSEGVKRAVEQAVELGEAKHVPSGLTPALSFEPYGAARVMANAATAHLSAGDFADTLDYGQLVSELVDTSDSVWSQALVRLDVATALTTQSNRDIEQAMQLGVQALTTSRDQPIRSVWQRAHDLAETVSSVDTPAVSDYTGELRSWSTANVASVQDRLTAGK